MRLFVSLRPPAGVLDHLARATAGLPTTPVDQWHVTLAFLGEVADAGPVQEQLARVADTSSGLRLQLHGGGFFVGPGVLFAALAGELDRLSELATSVEVACRSAGVHLAPRPYRPHLTVARRLAGDPGLLTGYAGPPWTVTELELVRSRLGTRAEHEVLSRHRLVG